MDEFQKLKREIEEKSTEELESKLLGMLISQILLKPIWQKMN